MNYVEIFTDKEKRTPKFMEKMHSIINEWCEVVNENEISDWFIECLTEKANRVEEQLETLSAEFPDTLISDRVRDMEFDGEIWQTWFLNGNSEYDDATIVFPTVSWDFLGDYEGTIC